MSRLIDVDKLLELLEKKSIYITFDLPIEEILGEDVDIDDFSCLVQDAIQAYRKMVIDVIRNQPTAYDVDAVVEKLDKYITKIVGRKSALYQTVMQIVKSGLAEVDE